MLTNFTAVSLRLLVQVVQDQQRIYMYVPCVSKQYKAIANHSKVLCAEILSISTRSCEEEGIHDQGMVCVMVYLKFGVCSSDMRSGLIIKFIEAPRWHASNGEMFYSGGTVKKANDT